MNIQVSCHTMLLNPLGTYPDVFYLDHTVVCFYFFGGVLILFPQGLYKFIFLPSLYRGLSFSTSLLAFVVESFLHSSQNQSARSFYSVCHTLSLCWMNRDGRALRFMVSIISLTFVSSSNISRPFSLSIWAFLFFCAVISLHGMHMHFYDRTTS